KDWTGQVVMYAVEGLAVFQKDMTAFNGGETRQESLLPNIYSQVVTTFEAYDVKLEGKTSFRVRGRSTRGPLGTWEPETNVGDTRVRLQLPGAHNVQNALAALTAASVLGIDADIIVKTLGGFSGIRRRFEIRNQGPIQVNGQPMDV